MKVGQGPVSLATIHGLKHCGLPQRFIPGHRQPFYHGNISAAVCGCCARGSHIWCKNIDYTLAAFRIMKVNMKYKDHRENRSQLCSDCFYMWLCCFCFLLFINNSFILLFSEQIMEIYLLPWGSRKLSRSPRAAFVIDKRLFHVALGPQGEVTASAQAIRR